MKANSNIRSFVESIANGMNNANVAESYEGENIERRNVRYYSGTGAVALSAGKPYWLTSVADINKIAEKLVSDAKRICKAIGAESEYNSFDASVNFSDPDVFVDPVIHFNDNGAKSLLFCREAEKRGYRWTIGKEDGEKRLSTLEKTGSMPAEKVDEGLVDKVGKFARRVSTELKGGNFYDDVDSLGGMSFSLMKRHLQEMTDDQLRALASKARYSKGDRAQKVAKWVAVELHSREAKRKLASGSTSTRQNTSGSGATGKNQNYNQNGATSTGNSTYQNSGDPAYGDAYDNDRNYDMFGNRRD